MRSSQVPPWRGLLASALAALLLAAAATETEARTGVHFWRLVALSTTTLADSIFCQRPCSNRRGGGPTVLPHGAGLETGHADSSRADALPLQACPGAGP